MIVYLDVVVVINFIFDLFLLVSVNHILKRNAKYKRMVIASLVGGLSILALFIDFNSFTLFIFKLLISILMILISFGYKDIIYTFKNFLHLYLCSMILGGFMYFLNIQFSYKNEGLIFAYNGLSINIIGIFILGPLILVSYIKENKCLKLNYNNYYECELYMDKKHRISMNAFLDTGNKLRDPYTNKSIILVSSDMLKDFYGIPLYVPYNTLNNHGLLKCYKPYMIVINNRSTRNFLVGVSEQKIGIDGVDCIINNQILEDLL